MTTINEVSNNSSSGQNHEENQENQDIIIIENIQHAGDENDEEKKNIEESQRKAASEKRRAALQCHNKLQDMWGKKKTQNMSMVFNKIQRTALEGWAIDHALRYYWDSFLRNHGEKYRVAISPQDCITLRKIVIDILEEHAVKYALEETYEIPDPEIVKEREAAKKEKEKANINNNNNNNNDNNIPNNNNHSNHSNNNGNDSDEKAKGTGSKDEKVKGGRRSTFAKLLRIESNRKVGGSPLSKSTDNLASEEFFPIKIRENAKKGRGHRTYSVSDIFKVSPETPKPDKKDEKEGRNEKSAINLLRSFGSNLKRKSKLFTSNELKKLHQSIDEGMYEEPEIQKKERRPNRKNVKNSTGNKDSNSISNNNNNSNSNNNNNSNSSSNNNNNNNNNNNTNDESSVFRKPLINSSSSNSRTVRTGTKPLTHSNSDNSKYFHSSINRSNELQRAKEMLGKESSSEENIKYVEEEPIPLVKVKKEYSSIGELSELIKSRIDETFPEPAPYETDQDHEFYHFSFQGSRASNEDEYSVVEYANELIGLKDDSPKYSFVAVYDGHSGKYVSLYSRSQVHYNIFNHPDFESNTDKTIHDLFISTDELVNEYQRLEKFNCGTTALCVWIKGNKELIVANVGDCRGFINRNGTPIEIADPHSPAKEEEKDRIIASGGAVVRIGTWRVNGVLSVSRSIGDNNLRDLVIATPDITKFTLEDNDEYLCIASDGLWDVFTYDQVIKYIQDNLGSKGKTKICKALCEEAVLRKSQDNITVVVVFFKKNI